MWRKERREMGYTRVKNIGGICLYLGKDECGSERKDCWRGACCAGIGG